jgi:hypothetical protein
MAAASSKVLLNVEKKLIRKKVQKGTFRHIYRKISVPL